MSARMMSATQSAGNQGDVPDYGTPLSGSSTTYGSVGARTAWTTAGISGGRPAPYSKRTKGSTLSWDDDNDTPTQPQADFGASSQIGG